MFFCPCNSPVCVHTQVEGRELPVLCTLSRDGAFFTWTFTPSLALGGGKQQQQQQGATVVVGGGPQPKKQRLADGLAAQTVSCLGLRCLGAVQCKMVFWVP